MNKETKYAICLGAFAPCADRFVVKGYHKELSLGDMLQRVALVEGVSGVELDYPSVFTDAARMKALLDEAGLKASAVEIDHYSDPRWRFGAFTSPDKALRRQAVAISQAGMDAAAELGASRINLWLAHDGWDYPLQADYPAYWAWTVDAVREVAAYRSDIQVCIEYKPKEPRTHSFTGTVGQALLLVNAVGLPNVGVNIDTGHALMAGENLAHSAMLCAQFGRLFYLHLNDNYRDWDHDMIFASVHLWETIELLYWLNQLNYDGWYALDIYPYREDAVRACQESIRNLNLLTEIARRLDDKQLHGLRVSGDGSGLVAYLRDSSIGAR